jgi:hypothetical protein
VTTASNNDFATRKKFEFRGRSMSGASRDVCALLTFLGQVSGTPTNYFEVEPPPGAPGL